jgi:hypothetical protein
VIGVIPLRRRSGELSTDAELARVGRLFLAVTGVVLFVILIGATIVKAT